MKYILTLFKAYFQDMRSLDKIRKNNWIQHTFISVLFIIPFSLFLKYKAFIMQEALWFQYFVLLFIPFILYFGFERIQGMYAKLTEHETPSKFESDKDVVASWFISSIIGVLVYIFL